MDGNKGVSRLFFVLALGLFVGFILELLQYGFDLPTLFQGVGGAVFAMVGTWLDGSRP